MLKIIQRGFNFFTETFDRVVSSRMKISLFQAIPFWIASILTGVVTVIYTIMFSGAESLMMNVLHYNKWLIFIQMPLFMILAWWMVYKYSSFSKGSGIPQVMAAVEMVSHKQTRNVSSLVSLRVAVIKILSSVFMACGGGAIGREGPTIQIAASIFNFINKHIPKSWPKIKPANMIIGGAAAGLAAAFNTPLGGIVFAVEELSKTHVSFYRTALFSAVIIAGLTAQGILGPYLYLGYPVVKGVSWTIIGYVMIVAIVGGVLAGYFAKMVLAILAYKRKNFKSISANILYIFFVAIILAAWAIWIDHGILGSGKELMQHILFTEDKKMDWFDLPQRFIGPMLSFTTGAAGGVFAPSLGAGAALGGVVSHLFQLGQAESNLVILAGMVAFLTGLTRSPFTSAILVLEMTDRHSVIFYLMLAGMLASVSALLVDRKSFYEHMKEEYLQIFKEREQNDIEQSEITSSLKN